MRTPQKRPNMKKKGRLIQAGTKTEVELTGITKGNQIDRRLIREKVQSIFRKRKKTKGTGMKYSGNIKELTVTQTALGRALGLTTARINQMIDLEIVVRDERDPNGGVYLFESLRNYYQSKKAKEEDANLFKEKALHEKVKRQIAELKLAKEEGSVYEAGTVEAVMIEQLVALRTHLLSLGMKLAPQLEGKTPGEIADIINREVEDRLKELSSYKAELFKGEG